MEPSIAERVRRARPLVHAITNVVTIEWMARGLLAAGARPVMVLDPAEAAGAASTADALLLNLGTLSADVQEAMIAAGRAANRKGIPVVLDPVGAGGLPGRTEVVRNLLAQVKVTAIRGNYGEVAALAGYEGLVRGVDVVAAGPGSAPLNMAAVAAAVAARYGCLVAATGAVDVVSDGVRTLEVKSGHPIMDQITGSGCLCAAVLAAALAAGPQDLNTMAETLLWLGAAGEAAACIAAGPGSFTGAYLDALAAAATLPEGRIAPPLSERLACYVIVSGTTPLEVVEAVLEAGVKSIQFREKHLPVRDQVAPAARMRELCRQAGALFLVNDRVDLAQAVEADGVHLGQEDLPAAAARRMLGPDAVIGISCGTEAEAQAAEREGADYLGAGPIYPTGSKPDARAPLGIGMLERIVRSVRVPVVGIGGIDVENTPPVIRTGACGVSVISAVVHAADPGKAAAQLLQTVQAAKGSRIG